MPELLRVLSMASCEADDDLLRRPLYRSLEADELTGVHDVVRIESAFYSAHQLDLDRRLVVGDFVALQAPDAVLGADRPMKSPHNAVDDVVELLPAREISSRVGAFRLGQIKMDVPVADVAERHRPNAREPFGHSRGGADDEIGHPANRYRNVMLDRARVKLRLDDCLANLPELLGLRPALGDDSVGDQILFECRFEQPLQK